ncbi:MAG: hypothetical protein J1F01_00580 [Oscillospiraceae bacterium]|nr:hypothetical protein [Oscillospiraceae bacterium]
MLRNISDILAVSCGYAAAIIGAGFASGQEIVSFFVKYGRYSIIGILIACVMFFLFSCAVLCICAENRIYNYSDFLHHVFRNKRVCKVIEFMTLAFAVVSICVMTACAARMGSIIVGVSPVFGSAVFTVICGIILFLGNKKIMKINSGMGAVIIFGIIFSCLYILRFREHQSAAVETSMVVSGIVYAGYNLLTAGTVLAGMSRNIKDSGEAVLSSAVSGLLLFVMMTLVWGVLSIYYNKINLGEIPMLTMTLRQNNALGMFYSAMLFFAVFSTGVSNGFGVIDIMHGKAGRRFTTFILLLLSFCMSGAGFSNLINVAYRICGYIGMIIVFGILFNYFMMIKKSKIKKNKENISIKEKNI